MQQVAPRTQRFFRCSPRDLGMVILLRKVRQHNVSCSSIIVAGKEIRECIIRQVPYPAHYPLFHRPGIRASPQHLHVMVGLNYQDVAAAQMITNVGWDVSEISSNSHFDAFGAKGKSHRIGGVMRDGEWRHCNIADLKPGSRGEQLELAYLRLFSY